MHKMDFSIFNIFVENWASLAAKEGSPAFPDGENIILANEITML